MLSHYVYMLFIQMVKCLQWAFQLNSAPSVSETGCKMPYTEGYEKSLSLEKMNQNCILFLYLQQIFVHVIVTFIYSTVMIRHSVLIVEIVCILITTQYT
jgi:hypothetical protein